MSNKPRVLNRTGRRIPDGAVYIGRAVPRACIAGSKWGNPFKPTNAGERRTIRGEVVRISTLTATSRL